jgi:hypothetical protein
MTDVLTLASGNQEDLVVDAAQSDIYGNSAFSRFDSQF